MIKVNHIDHLNLNIKKGAMEETINFYKKHFGMRVLEEEVRRDEKYVLIGNKAFILALYEDKDFKQVDKHNFNHFGVHVENFEEAYEYFMKEGIVSDYGLIKYEDSQSFYITDPNNYELDISKSFGGGHV